MLVGLPSTSESNAISLIKHQPGQAQDQFDP
jgi:hypothetical protein